MLAWVEGVLLKSKYIGTEDRNLLHLTDSPSEVVDIVRRSQDTLARVHPDSYDI
jgi:hypothetical protein